jgi:hypothetical protein
MSTSYLIAIVVMVAVSIFGIVLYSIFSTHENEGTFIGFVSATLAPIIGLLVVMLRSEQQNRLAIDSANEAREARAEAREEARLTREETREEARLAREEAKQAREEVVQAKEIAQETKTLTEETHKLVNSRLEEFKETVAQLERAKGRREGMEQGRSDAEARTDSLYTGRDNVVHHEGIIRHEEMPIIEPQPLQEPEPENPPSDKA